MRSLIRTGLLLLAATRLAHPAPTLTYTVLGNSGAWPGILRLAGLVPSAPSIPGDVMVVTAGAKADLAVLEMARRGALVILEGESGLANSASFRANGQKLTVRSAVDRRNSRLQIVWEKAVEVPRIDLPRDARVFMEERWTSAPLMAGIRMGSGAVLWLAVGPGPMGYERFPYLLQAMQELGLRPAFRASALWLSLIHPIACASIRTTLPRSGARRGFRACTWPRGISTIRIRSGMSI